VRDTGRLRGEHLADTAGQRRERSPEPAPVGAGAASPVPGEPAPAPASPSPRPSQAELIAALIAANLNQAECARRLNLHRTQLRRYIAYYGIDLAKLRAALP
jgi:transcriptional regulator with GAF, ATPase, and Fis domain